MAGSKLDRVVRAVDCGVSINSDVIRAQGGRRGRFLVWGDSVWRHFFERKAGSNNRTLTNYHVLRVNEMAKVEVYIVNSTELPTGIGEPRVPPTGPAVSNAIFAERGKRMRKLAFADAG
jgi:isoquinoline 1-oxidoreductase beta subunit